MAQIFARGRKTTSGWKDRHRSRERARMAYGRTNTAGGLYSPL